MKKAHRRSPITASRQPFTVAEGRIITQAYEEWLTELQERFPDGNHTVSLVCPCCRNIATVADFRAAGVEDANVPLRECIGRYAAHKTDCHWNTDCQAKILNRGRILRLEDDTIDYIFDFPEPADYENLKALQRLQRAEARKPKAHKQQRDPRAINTARDQVIFDSLIDGVAYQRLVAAFQIGAAEVWGSAERHLYWYFRRIYNQIPFSERGQGLRPALMEKVRPAVLVARAKGRSRAISAEELEHQERQAFKAFAEEVITMRQLLHPLCLSPFDALMREHEDGALTRETAERLMVRLQHQSEAVERLLHPRSGQAVDLEIEDNPYYLENLKQCLTEL